MSFKKLCEKFKILAALMYGKKEVPKNWMLHIKEVTLESGVVWRPEIWEVPLDTRFTSMADSRHIAGLNEVVSGIETDPEQALIRDINWMKKCIQKRAEETSAKHAKAEAEVASQMALIQDLEVNE